VFTKVQPDILVGRAGPGWVALDKAGKIERGPSFFAADPYVILVAPGNPMGITGPADLGKEGIRIAGARHAMRPKGKCAGHLMETATRRFHPGLDEMWENNAGTLGELRCGRHLADPIIRKQADAAIGYLSLTTYPGVRGKVDAVPVAARYIKPMTACKATVGQCLCVLKGAQHPDLALQFHHELTGDVGRRVMEHHGYIHITSPQAKQYGFLMRGVQVPRRMPPWQVHLADLLAADGIKQEAVRRYLTVIHVFGPGEHDAYCRYRVGELLAETERVRQATGQWRRVVRDFPRPNPQEYRNRAFDLVAEGPAVTEEPEQHWVAAARARLSGLPRRVSSKAVVRLPDWLPRIDLEPPQVTEGDPGKNGTRNFCLAEDLFLVGDYEFAIRDYLKVLTLCYPSRHMAAASFKLGLCQFMRADYGAARDEWERTVKDFAGSEWSGYAATGLENIPAARQRPRSAMPEWEPQYETWPQRGMTYGMALYRHHMPRFAFKEMVKLVHGEYGASPLDAEARYRAGIAAAGTGTTKAAMLQWRVCVRDHPNTPWAQQCRERIDELCASTPLARRSLNSPLPKLASSCKLACHERLAIAEEFFHSGFTQDEETALEYLKALTVTRASPGGYDQAIVPRAEERLAQCLEEMGNDAAAQRHRIKARMPVDKKRPRSGRAPT